MPLKLPTLAVLWAPRGNLRKVPIKLPRLAVLGAPVFDSLKSVHKTAKVGSYACPVRKVSIKLPALAVLVTIHFYNLRKVSIKLPRLAVMHGRSEKCPYNCQRWQFLWLPVKLPALAVLSALFCVDKTASVGSFDGTFKTAVYGSCSQVYRDGS